MNNTRNVDFFQGYMQQDPKPSDTTHASSRYHLESKPLQEDILTIMESELIRTKLQSTVIMILRKEKICPSVERHYKI